MLRRLWSGGRPAPVSPIDSGCVLGGCGACRVGTGSIGVPRLTAQSDRGAWWLASRRVRRRRSGWQWHVAVDLGAEGFGGGEAVLGAEAVEEGQSSSGVFSVRSMGWKLSRWDSTVKESAPKVGRLPTLVTASKVSACAPVPMRERGDVDAVGGEELGIGREVDGGDGVAGAVAAA